MKSVTLFPIRVFVPHHLGQGLVETCEFSDQSVQSPIKGWFVPCTTIEIIA